MVNENRYFDELQKIIRDTKSADEINEHWDKVLKRLDNLAIEYDKELQAETGILYDEFEKKRDDIWQFPPYRLLTMNLILSYWIGWHTIPKRLHMASDWTRIEDAYNKGKNAFIQQTDLGDQR